MRRWNTVIDKATCPACASMDGFYGRTIATPNAACTNPDGCRCTVTESCQACGETYKAGIPHRCETVDRPAPVPMIPVTLDACWGGRVADLIPMGAPTPVIYGRFKMTLPAAPGAGDLVLWNWQYDLLLVRRVAYMADGLAVDTEPVPNPLTEDARARMAALGWEFSAERV